MESGLAMSVSVIQPNLVNSADREAAVATLAIGDDAIRLMEAAERLSTSFPHEGAELFQIGKQIEELVDRAFDISVGLSPKVNDN
jgi:thiamine biosynthesis lipoprotein ApbE